MERPVNKFKKEPFAFAFITFASVSPVESLIKQKNTEVGSFQLEIKPAKLQVKKPARPYLVKKRKLSPSSSTLKKSRARAANYYERISHTTLNIPVFIGKSFRCKLIRMLTPEELWLRDEGRRADFYKMKDKMQYHFLSKSKELPDQVSVITPGSIFAIKKDHGWTRARVLSTNKERSSLLLGDVGEIAEVENKDLQQLPEEFQYEDFFAFRLTIPAGDWSEASEVAEDYLNKNPIIVEVGKSVVYSQSNMYFLVR